MTRHAVAPVLKAYVSATYQDLKDCRQRAGHVLRRMGYLDVAMEYYTAEDRRSLDRCLDDVAACDLYIGIFAWRYGWVPPHEDRRKLSITEREYRRAAELGKPRLLFLLDESAPWPPALVDDNKARIRKLRAALAADRQPALFTSPDTLESALAAALSSLALPRSAAPPPRRRNRRAATPPEIDERRYAERMRQKYHVLDLAAFAPPGEEEWRPLRLQELFLPQDVRENPPPVELPWDLRRRLAGSAADAPEAADAARSLPDDIARERLERMRSVYAEQPRRPVLEALAEPASRRAVLLGDPGSGKSTLAKYLLLSLLAPSPAPQAEPSEPWLQAFSGHLPLLVELREFIAERSRGRCATFLEFLHHLGKTQGYALDKTALARRLRRGPSLVLFDGLDEIFAAGERERVLHEIVGFCADFPSAAVVVTSRPAGYADSILRAAAFRHFALQELADPQIERFVRGWFALTFPGRPAEAAPRVGRVLTACERSRSIRLLAGNPLLLTIMAMIARQRDLPRERARFYEFSAEVLCHHWDLNRHLEQAGFKLDYLDLDDKKDLLRRIAWRMQAARQGLAGNFLHGDDLRDELTRFLARDGKASATEVKRIAQALIDQLHTRNYILCLYGPDLYGFVHRSFLEFFCADELRRRVHENPDYPIDRLLAEEIARHWQDPAWEEVLRLLCGTIGEAHAGRIIAYLTTEANPYWWADPDTHHPGTSFSPPSAWPR